MIRFARFQIVLAALAAAFIGAQTLAAQPLTFEEHIRPILRAHCFACHGDEEEKEANLDLRLVRSMAKGGDSGPAIVPGKAAASLIVERIAAGEMPPEGKGKPLAAKDVAVLKAWLDQGGKTARPEPAALAGVTDIEKEFWSFRPLAEGGLPRVAGVHQLRSPIDAFLLAELEKRKLIFSPAAD